MKIDLNCDMGEGMATDEAIMPYISSANIACGFHAGDENTMKNTIDLCLKYKVAIGAHPGFDDKENFGRTNINLSNHELYQLITEQISLLDSFCKEKKATLHHIKPHGALYNMAAQDKNMASSIAKAIRDYNPNLIVYGLSNSYLISESQNIGLKVANEVFADRTYQDDGSLTPRSMSNAIITDKDAAINQVLHMILNNKVKTINEKLINIIPQTVCLHGDGEFALPFAKRINLIITQNNIAIETV